VSYCNLLAINDVSYRIPSSTYKGCVHEDAICTIVLSFYLYFTSSTYRAVLVVSSLFKIVLSKLMAAVHLTLRMLQSIRLTNQKIEFYKLTNQKCFEAFVAPSGPQP